MEGEGGTEEASPSQVRRRDLRLLGEGLERPFTVLCEARWPGPVTWEKAVTRSLAFQCFRTLAPNTPRLGSGRLNIMMLILPRSICRVNVIPVKVH